MTSYSDMWRQMPLILQRSLLTFGKTSTVLQQLQQPESALKSLRLMGVEGTVCIQNLAEALRYNTTLTSLCISGNFLQTVVVYTDTDTEYTTGTGTGTGTSASASVVCPITILFQAIGRLPQLTHLTLQGTEDADAFPVAALIQLLKMQQQADKDNTDNNKGGGGALSDLTLQYVDLVSSSPQQQQHQQQNEWIQLGDALKHCQSLKRVQMTSLKLTSTQPAQLSSVSLLDPIVANLGHCQHVQVGMRHRNTTTTHNTDNAISCRALQSLLLASSNMNNTNNHLQSLHLGRRITLHTDQLSTILLAAAASATLQELQLDLVDVNTCSSDEILLSPPTTSATTKTATANDDKRTLKVQHHMAFLFQQQQSSSLTTLDITFATPWLTSTSTSTSTIDPLTANTNNNNKEEKDDPLGVITDALQCNTSLKKLYLRGAIHSGEGDHPYRPFAELLEHYNTTLEEVVLAHHPPPSEQPQPQGGGGIATTTTTSSYYQKMEFFLLLNRQPVIRNNSVGLRTLLQQQNGAVPQYLLWPCLKAAMQVDSKLDELQRQRIQSRWDQEEDDNNNNNDNHHHHHHNDDIIAVAEAETDFYGYVYHSSWHPHQHHATTTASSRDHAAALSMKTNKSIGALFYLLQSQPSFILAWQRQQQRQAVLMQQQQQKATTSISRSSRCGGGSNSRNKANILLCGASPQLLLLDDDIVALW